MDDILKAINVTDTVIDSYLGSNEGSEQHTKGIVLKENKAEIQKWVSEMLDSKQWKIGMENPRKTHDEIISFFKLKFPTYLRTLIERYQGQFAPQNMTDESLEKEISDLVKIKEKLESQALQDKSNMPGHLPKTGGIYKNDENLIAKAIDEHQEKAKRNLPSQLAAHDFDTTENDQRRNLEANTNVNMISGSQEVKSDSFKKQTKSNMRARTVFFSETANVAHYPSEKVADRLGELLEERERREQLRNLNRKV